MKKQGYILIFTLLIIAAVMIITTYITVRSRIYIPFVRMAINREKAKILALSGLEIARAQLSKSFIKEETKKDTVSRTQSATEKKPEITEHVQLLKTILPSINRWNTYTLTHEIDGINAIIKVCIMCEEGKINLNKVYNFEKKRFIGETEPQAVNAERASQKNSKNTEHEAEAQAGKNWKREVELICTSLEQITGAKNMFSALEKMLKSRTDKFVDITELLTLKEFAPLKDIVFYEPPSEEKKLRQLYLTDIFTLFSSGDSLEPWLLSDSLLSLLNLQRAQLGDIKLRKEKINELLKNFKPQAQWKEDWDTTLALLYGKELRSLPKNIDSFMNPTFDPHYFSIIVHAKVEDVTQRVYAIIERTKRSEKNNIMYTVTIKKLYWL